MQLVFSSACSSHLISLSLNGDHQEMTGFYYCSHKSVKGCTVTYDNHVPPAIKIKMCYVGFGSDAGEH